MDAGAFTIPNTCARVFRTHLRCVARVSITTDRTHIMAICATPYAGQNCAFQKLTNTGPANAPISYAGGQQVFATSTNGRSPTYAQAVAAGLSSRVTSMHVAYQRQYPNLLNTNNYTQESVMYVPPYSQPLPTYSAPSHGIIGKGSWILTPTPCDENIFRNSDGTTDTYDPKYPWVLQDPLNITLPYSFAKLTQQLASSSFNTEGCKDIWIVDIFAEHRGASPTTIGFPFTDQSLVTIYLNSLALDVIHRLCIEYSSDYNQCEQSTQRFIIAFNRLPKHARRSMYPGVNNPMMISYHPEPDALGMYLVHDSEEGWEHL